MNSAQRRAWQSCMALLIGLSACGTEQSAPANNNAAAAFRPPSFRQLQSPEGAAEQTHYAMIADPEMPADDYLSAARARCGSHPKCSIWAVTDPASALENPLSPSNRQLAGLVFQYDSETQHGPAAVWNCDRFPQIGTDRCFRVWVRGQTAAIDYPATVDGQPARQGFRQVERNGVTTIVQFKTQLVGDRIEWTENPQ